MRDERTIMIVRIWWKNQKNQADCNVPFMMAISNNLGNYKIF